MPTDCSVRCTPTSSCGFRPFDPGIIKSEVALLLMIKCNQFLTQFIIFSLRNRQYRSIFKSYFIAFDIADKFRVDQITAVDGDQGISGLFLQVGDAVFYKSFSVCGLDYGFLAQCGNK